MNAKLSLAAACLTSILMGCITNNDHFYTLNSSPKTQEAAPLRPRAYVRLSVTIPALVDRAEMVLTTSENSILMLDHERWAVGLSDQVTQTLARDIETRRGDVLVGDQGFAAMSLPVIDIKIDIVQMSARRGSQTSVSAHWHVADGHVADGHMADGHTGTGTFGTGTFDAPLNDPSYAAIAQGYSTVLNALAQRIADSLGKLQE